LLESWTWAAAAIGELYPLVFLGLDEADKARVDAELPKYHLEEYAQLLPRAHPSHLPAIYQRAAALVQPGPLAAWGEPVRHALACGRPVVAFKDAESEALIGPAGYLVEPGDLRAFGAAVITVVVDDKVRSDLESAAQKRSARWEASAFQSSLAELYSQKV
jgi:glycosyltransferase involved in cell wall biosynthesis